MMDMCITDITTEHYHQYLIKKLPKILMLQLSRYSPSGAVDNRYISFPLILDVAPYCSNTEVNS